MDRRPSNERRAGFSLIELILVMLIITVLAGVTLPVAGTLFDREATKATRAEMQNLATAAEAYFADTQTLPTTATALVVDPGVAGWAGPYASGGVQPSGASNGDFDLDGWDVPYALTIAGDTWTLVSGGSDRAVGTGDDLQLAVSVAPERRSVTVERLKQINLAVRLYNEDWLSPPPPQVADPLSSTWPAARVQLVARGYLSDDAALATDGWGDDFARTGSSGPVTAFESVNIGP